MRWRTAKVIFPSIKSKRSSMTKFRSGSSRILHRNDIESWKQLVRGLPPIWDAKRASSIYSGRANRFYTNAASTTFRSTLRTSSMFPKSWKPLETLLTWTSLQETPQSNTLSVWIKSSCNEHVYGHAAWTSDLTLNDNEDNKTKTKLRLPSKLTLTKKKAMKKRRQISSLIAPTWNAV